MSNYQNYKGLLAAVLIQAIKDRQSSTHRQDADAFIESDAFDWAWTELTDDMIGMSAIDTAKEQIAGDKVSLHRGAYHSALKGGETQCGFIFSKRIL